MVGPVRGAPACAVFFLAGCAGPVEAPKSIAEQLEEAGVSSSTAAPPTVSPTPSPTATPSPEPKKSAEPTRSPRRDPSRTALAPATDTAAGAKAFGRYVAQLTLSTLAKNDSSVRTGSRSTGSRTTPGRGCS